MASDDPKFVAAPIDQTEFHRLFVQSQRRIFGHILTLLPRMTDAEDVFQQTCVIILGKAAQFTPGTDFVRWACQIAQYEVYNYRRRQQAERLHFNDGLLDKIAARRLESRDMLDAELDAMRKCVDKLPPADRQLIQEQYRRRITSRALAAELGRPINTVYKAIQRIRHGLRECIERAVVRESHVENGMGPIRPVREDRP
jgi:RNA polymerase sigma-70 factor (ECF subfamily)